MLYICICFLSLIRNVINRICECICIPPLNKKTFCRKLKKWLMWNIQRGWLLWRREGWSTYHFLCSDNLFWCRRERPMCYWFWTITKMRRECQSSSLQEFMRATEPVCGLPLDELWLYPQTIAILVSWGLMKKHHTVKVLAYVVA